MNVDNVRCYANGIVIFSVNTEEHAIHFGTVFGIMKNNGLRVGIKKCSFMQPSVELLGYSVDKNGVHVNDQKVEKVRDPIPPTTRKELRSFLGVASYYRRFILDEHLIFEMRISEPYDFFIIGASTSL